MKVESESAHETGKEKTFSKSFQTICLVYSEKDGRDNFDLKKLISRSIDFFLITNLSLSE